MQLKFTRSVALSKRLPLHGKVWDAIRENFLNRGAREGAARSPATPFGLPDLCSRAAEVLAQLRRLYSTLRCLKGC